MFEFRLLLRSIRAVPELHHGHRLQHRVHHVNVQRQRSASLPFNHAFLIHSCVDLVLLLECRQPGDGRLLDAATDLAERVHRLPAEQHQQLQPATVRLVL